jgi:hypothetical protein
MSGFALSAISTAVAASVLTGLIGSEPVAIALDATRDDTAHSAKVVDATTPANSFYDSIAALLGDAAFPSGKLVQLADGTIRYTPHNLVQQSEDPSNGYWTKSNCTVTLGQVDSAGGTAAALLTTSGGTTQSHFNRSVVGTTGAWHTAQIIVRAGTSGFCYFRFNDGTDRYAYFNVGTKAAATVAAGLVANVYTSDVNGIPYPAGYFRIAASIQTAGSLNVYFGHCNADGAPGTSVGKTIYAEKMHVHMGLVPLAYLKTTTAAKASTPYDWSRGERTMLCEPVTTYNSLWSDDLTNAAWTKTNGTPALDATGPHGHACSSFTATADNATVTQAITNATSTQMFSVYLRRRTGTGTVSLTSNGGTAWTDITSQLTGSWKRFNLAGIANPTIGLKLGANTDAIEWALGLNCAQSFLSSPLPTYGASRVRTADAVTVQMSKFTNDASVFSFYLDCYRGDVVSSSDNLFSLGNSSFTQQVAMSMSANVGSFSVNDGTGTNTYKVWTATAGERLEITARVQANAHIVSINGEPPAQLTTAGMPAVTQFYIAKNAPVYVRRLVIAPRDVGRAAVRTWRRVPVVRNSVVAQYVAAWDSDPAFPGTSMNREPSLSVLSDDGSIAIVAMFWMQKRASGFNAEAPARLMQRNFQITKGAITPLTAATVIMEPPRWASGLGHVQSPAAFVIASGPKAGRLGMLFTQEDSASGTFSDDARNVYLMLNDGGVGGATIGDPSAWGAPSLVYSGGSASSRVADPSGSVVILPAGHPVAPNRIVSYFYTGATITPIYSDDYGDTWTLGATFSASTSINECNLALLPDGTIVGTARVATAPLYRRSLFMSTDGGATFTDQGMIASYSGSECAAGLCQIDPTGTTGTYGKLLLSHPVATASRIGFAIDESTDGGLTLSRNGGVNSIFDPARYFGYSSIKSLFGGSHVAVGVEYGSVPFNTDNSALLILYQAQ